MKVPLSNDGSSSSPPLLDWVNVVGNDAQIEDVYDTDTVDLEDTQTEDLSLTLEPLPQANTLHVNIDPPPAPRTPLSHVPSDIVLVIDVSGSMETNAPIPGEDPNESTGLCILDLVKHAARTIVETMGEHDRLGIVTFDSVARIVQHLRPMTPSNKATSRENIDKMMPGTATNMWYGMRDAFKVFQEASGSTNVPAMMILTDGMPNYMCPREGYVPKLRTMAPFPASIHTFGFGYSLNSHLLKSIADIGGGNYAFIPDAGMIGTVFVHAVANLQATHAMNATLTLTYPAPLEIQTAMGESVDQTPPHTHVHHGKTYSTLNINVGNVLYGQARNIVLRVKNIPTVQSVDELNPPIVDACLKYKRSTSKISEDDGSPASPFARSPVLAEAVARRSVLDSSRIPSATMAYHESRARICSFLSSTFSSQIRREDLQSRTPCGKTFTAIGAEFAALMEDLPAQQYMDDLNRSLMEDLTGPPPHGEISLAINTKSNFYRWGVHYLPSYLSAHSRQMCNTFKDTGPLQYGANSPLFIACRDRLDEAFDQLPAPTPSLPRSEKHSGHVSMRSYNNRGGPCFAGSTPVTLASGRSVPIRKLRRGVKVSTPAGVRRVAMVLKTPVQMAMLCCVGAAQLLVTPWHPISCDGGKTWAFPANVAESRPVPYSGAVYSVLLQRDRSAAAHAIRVGGDGVWGVTLGHGILRGGDVRAHTFLGDYNSVGKSLIRLGADNKGVVVGGGVERDANSGLICGFRKRMT
ncbi:hypothetical protein S40285_02715 [Stachybotrys chlorohalonatus IBT 40285]|uniref:VWFA domain-containing protein n=1 Tax=Stachybotrys chlorohalonatus (strain IBT 40285) TaxID=1283841 RepID=A0A084QMV5_STAC4|nr:hypothetical protein S40285_02715 [Stachybotrys chlorohalonata IBT 40285]